MLTGYRCGFTDWRTSLRSIFMWHNETVNIWSHLLGAIAFLVCIFVFLGKYKDMWVDGAKMMSEYEIS